MLTSNHQTLSGESAAAGMELMTKKKGNKKEATERDREGKRGGCGLWILLRL